MHRRTRTALVALAAVALIALIAFAASVGAAPKLRSPICTRGLTTVERDPRSLLTLAANAISPAAGAALRLEQMRNKPVVVKVALATADAELGSQVRTECGRRVWSRTVVVYITLRAFGSSASLSERVDFVGRFADGYHVWQIVH